MTRLHTPGAVRWICRTLEEAGHEAWAVGGAVRDRLAGRSSGDWDLTTSARPQELRRLFRRTVPVGVEHGTVGILARDGTMYEVTTFRRDVETSGRHAVVAFADSLDEDLARRDFTINAIAWHPLREVLHDPWGGEADLREGRLRTVGAPAERFAEDYLRVLRALRFAGGFRLEIDPESWRALTAAVPGMTILSAERVREELDKVLESSRPSASLGLYGASGALGFLFPELTPLLKRDGRRPGPWTLNLLSLDLLSARRSSLRWAALLAGIGRPEGGFDGTEGGVDPFRRALLRSAALLRRLRSSNARIEEVATLVARIDAAPSPDLAEPELRRVLSDVGRGALPSLLRLWGARARVLDRIHGEDTRTRVHVRRARRLRGLARAQLPLAIEELAIGGRDLIRAGHSPGPHFGELLRHLLDRVIEEPELNERERLLEIAEGWMEAHDAR